MSVLLAIDDTPQPQPRWDEDSKILRLGDQVVKTFLMPAFNQFRVLDAFEASGWPDSLPAQVEQWQVKETLLSLNERQSNSASIEFRKDKGGGLYWIAKISGAQQKKPYDARAAES